MLWLLTVISFPLWMTVSPFLMREICFWMIVLFIDRIYLIPNKESSWKKVRSVKGEAPKYFQSIQSFSLTTILTFRIFYLWTRHSNKGTDREEVCLHHYQADSQSLRSRIHLHFCFGDSGSWNGYGLSYCSCFKFQDSDWFKCYFWSYELFGEDW